FSAVGWRLFVSGMRALADAPAVLSAADRASLQRSVGARLVRHLRVEVQIEGVANLPRSPHVIVALHEGIADVLCLSLLELPCRIVAREEIFGWPWIGPALARMRHIAIEPEHGAASYRRLLAAARETLSAGEHVVLFPQGAVLGIETAFQPGAFRLAQRLGAPILPIVLSGSHRIWEHPFSPCLRYGQRAAAVVLPPLSVAEVAACADDELRVKLQQRMKSVALSGRLPAPRRYVPQRDGFWDGFAFEIDPAFPEVRDAVAAHRRTHRGS
ncbi:MAG: lysophospholipid acyltransferase family protein, partial [Sphingopyxis sp.]